MTSDLYDYALRAKQVLRYAQNPLVHPTVAVAGDPWLAFSYWRAIPTPYGPLWLLINLLPHWATGGRDLMANLLGLKLLALAAHLGNVALLDRILARLASDQRAAGTLLFGWNPLVLLELVGNGHNDGQMLFFVLLAMLALVAGRWYFVFPALIAAALVKAAALLLAPLVAVMALRHLHTQPRQIGPIAGGLAPAAALATGLYGLFWAGPETLQHVAKSMIGAVHYSPAAAVAWIARRFAIDQSVTGRVASLSGTVIFLAITGSGWRAGGGSWLRQRPCGYAPAAMCSSSICWSAPPGSGPGI